METAGDREVTNLAWVFCFPMHTFYLWGTWLNRVLRVNIIKKTILIVTVKNIN